MASRKHIMGVTYSALGACTAARGWRGTSGAGDRMST